MHVNWDMVAALVQVFGFAGVVWGLVQNRRALQTQVAMEFYRRFAELRLATYRTDSFADLPEPTRIEIVLSLIEYMLWGEEELQGSSSAGELRYIFS